MAFELNIATKELQEAIKQDTELLLTKVAPAPEQDPYDTPGPQTLKTGTLDFGYFGFVSAVELITGDALALDIGLSVGTAQFSDAGWFKWAYNQKILFVAKKTFRHSISWNQINAIGAVFGTKTVSIGGKTYKVRLLTGGNGQPASEGGGEWNMVMYGVHQNYLPPWDYCNDQDLQTHNSHGNGSYSWCQETSSANPSNRVRRGNNGVSYFNTVTSSDTPPSTGWRPVLELL